MMNIKLDSYQSDTYPFVRSVPDYLPVLLVLVSIFHRAAISTAIFRRTSMSLHNNRQISRHTKTTFAGQLVCPHCQTVFPLTWRRYWSAPLGNYRCPKCRQISHTTATFWWVWLIIFVAMTLVGIVGALFAVYVFHDGWMGTFFISIGYLSVGFSLDKWIDGHLKHLKIRS
jgi:hypothetical protein